MYTIGRDGLLSTGLDDRLLIVLVLGIKYNPDGFILSNSDVRSIGLVDSGRFGVTGLVDSDRFGWVLEVVVGRGECLSRVGGSPTEEGLPV